VPFPADAKIGYVDLQRVVTESLVGKKGMEAMKALNDKLTTAITTKNKEIAALQDKIKAQQSVVSEPVLQGMARELDKMTREAQFMAQDADVQVNQLNEELMKSFSDKALPLVEEVRKERGLWIVFALGQNSNIAAAHAGLDLSLEVIKRLDTQYK
jgi:outer membrane protein